MKRLGVGILTFLMVVCTMFAAACTKVEFKVMFVVDGSVYASINTNGEEKIRMPDDPEKEGYIFDGWYWDEWSWQQPFTANSLFDAPLSSNMAVYAKWTTIEDLAGTQAEFDTFEKIGEYEYSLKVPNSTETISISPLVTINYNSSWSLTTDDYGNQTIASRTANLNVGDNTYYVVVRAANGATQLYTLNIRRRPIYNVVFDTFGGTFVETQQVEEDSFATLPQTTREGYEFSAWNYDFTTPITSNKTIVASWTPNTYTISLNPNGGSVSNATIEATYDQSCTLPTPLKTGYMLVGWNTEEDGSGVSYGDVNAILNLTSQNGATVELYAQWTERVVTATLADLSTTNPSHTVTFDLNGATGTAPAPQTVTDTLGLTYPTAPTRSEYVFAGWYATSSCTGSPYDFTADVTEDITLYAKWLSHSGYGTLRVGGNSGSITFPARSSSNYRYYAFVPLVSGSITIYSSSSYDTYGYLFNAVKTQIASDDDSGSGTNFSITYSVTAGELYYIVACAYSTSSSCTGTIYLSGTSTPTAGGKAEGITIVTEQLTYGQNFTLDVPTKVGCSFLGWYDGIGGTGTQYTDQFGASVKTWDKEEDVTLYAKWTESSGNNNTYEADLWDGTIASSFAGGSGTSASPYIIETGEQLAYLASRVNNGTSYSGYYFRLDNNIDLNNINWTPIGMGSTTDGGSYTDYAFSGNFDGNGKNISNLMINTTSLKKAGLFGAIYNATITKVSITEADVYISQNNIISGAILTGTMDNSTITQCFVQGEVEVIDRSSTGSHCANAGAIVGRTIENSRIENCLAQASVSGSMPNKWNAYVGGIAGSESSGTLTISKCAFIGTVYAYGYDDGYAGGILGMREATAYINNSFTVANVSSSDYANAIASPWQDAYPNVTNTYYSSNVTSSKGTSTSTTNFKSQSWLTSTLGWDFADVWTFVEGNDYPVLKAFNN